MHQSFSDHTRDKQEQPGVLDFSPEPWLMRVDVKNKSIVSSIDSSGGHFVCWKGTICAILVEDVMVNIHVKLV